MDNLPQYEGFDNYGTFVVHLFLTNNEVIWNRCLDHKGTDQNLKGIIKRYVTTNSQVTRDLREWARMYDNDLQWAYSVINWFEVVEVVRERQADLLIGMPNLQTNRR